MAFTGVLVSSSSSSSSSSSVLNFHSDSLSNKVHTKPTSLSCHYSTNNLNQATASDQLRSSDNDNLSHIKTPKTFTYTRATPSVRWPNLKLSEQSYNAKTEQTHFTVVSDEPTHESSTPKDSDFDSGSESLDRNDETQQVLGRTSKTKVKKMNKLALKRAKDWRVRVKYLTDRLLGLSSGEFVADVLDDRKVQMTPIDFCFVVKWVGLVNWQRALEVFEWLNLKHWYSPNPRMLATILAVLGKAGQDDLAEEMFERVGADVGPTVQVYNAMMGVHARSGRFEKARQMLDLMRERGCEPDLVSLNTLINARMKSGSGLPELAALELLDEVRRSGLRPDIITYNTLLSGCSKGSNLMEAMKIYDDMVSGGCQPDIWTYNAMISVYARCGLPSKADRLFKELEFEGFLPDAVTYNSLLYAFAREGNVERVVEICDKMVGKGFAKDEMTYNTLIHMYGKMGNHDLAFEVYRDMKKAGRNPDSVTYTVLIDSLGKANKTSEAESVMTGMLDAGVKPTLRTYSALICGYAKAGKQVEARETFDCMVRSGINPDRLAYSVMIDIFLRSNEIKKAMSMYRDMLRNNFVPDNGIYETMLRLLGKEDSSDGIEKVIRDLELVCGMSPQAISSILVKADCFDQAAKSLRLAITSGFELDRENLLSILSSYSSSGRFSEARELLEFLRENAPDSHQLVTEALVVILCKARKFDSAFEEYGNTKGFHSFSRSSTMYESLIQGCRDNELFPEASQVFSDMRFFGVKPSESLYETMILMYCEMGFPETAHRLIEEAEAKDYLVGRVYIYVSVINVYGKVKLWQNAESLVGRLKQRSNNEVDRKVWNALIHAYAESGCYERARAIFNTMMRDGPTPTVDSMNGLLQALINDGRLEELYVVIEELQDMGFKISKTSILLMLEAFARAGNVFEVKKMYEGMKAAGYFPTMSLYRVMVRLLCKTKRVRDVEAMMIEMEEAGFKPDIAIWNCVLRLFSSIEDFKRTVHVYQTIRESGLDPDEDTYNTLIIMYCKDSRPEEGLSLMKEMRTKGLDPKLDTYKSLISAFSKQQMYDQAEELFDELKSKGRKLDRSFYHTMIKVYRNSKDPSKAESLVGMMREAGLEPNFSTMHLLMVSYGGSGQPQEAERVLENLKDTGLSLNTLPYSSVIDAYLKNGEYEKGIEKLREMEKAGLITDHRIWTCFVRAASLAQQTSEAVKLLSVLSNTGFDLPIRLLTERSESELLISEVDQCLEKLGPLDDDAAFNFVNALVDLLWAFELRATASWVFQLAVKREIYRNDIFRVADRDWATDFRKLSAGSSLVALTLWLDHMQDASLQGKPESPKSVVLITGTSEYNSISINGTIKACLWEMGSPFLPSKTRTGILIAKAHSLRMWLKDSPFCLDLELRDGRTLPELNSMVRVGDGSLLRRGIVPAFEEINERLARVSPKKFSRLAMLSDEKREKSIGADIEGRREKLEKMKRNGVVEEKKKTRKSRNGKFVREGHVSLG